MLEYSIIVYNPQVRKKCEFVKKRTTKIQMVVTLKMEKVIAMVIWYKMLRLTVIVILSRHYINSIYIYI